MKKGDIKAAKKARPLINLNNMEVFIINRRYYNGLVNTSGIDLLALDKAMDYENIPEDEKPFLARKLLIYISYCLNKRSEAKHGGQTT